MHRNHMELFYSLFDTSRLTTCIPPVGQDMILLNLPINNVSVLSDDLRGVTFNTHTHTHTHVT